MLSEENGSLDPEDWAPFRALAHQAVDDMIDYLQAARERPTWQTPSQDSRRYLNATLPRQGAPLADVYRGFKEHILPYPTGNTHPRFWGWVMGTGTHVSLLADLLASAMNCHVSGYDQAATLVEHEVMGWLREIFGFPEGSTGVLVSGGTVANLICVAAARNSLTGIDIRKDGSTPHTTGPLAIYGSVATHGWIDRSCDLLGLGLEGFHKGPVDDRERIRVDELAQIVAADRQRGVRPVCIVGNAGTVATGAIDDLHALADLAEREGVWFHVDGAFGALAALSPKYRGLVGGMERADSLAFDLHKWGYMQYETGGVLIRDGKAHEKAFSIASPYLETFTGGIAVQPTEFAGRGIQLSRGFRALRVWMNLSVYGTERLGHAIETNIDDAQYLAARITKEHELELLEPVAMNVVCFRFVTSGMSDAELDTLNAHLLVRLQESGVAVPSNTRIRGCFAIRVAHTNHRTIRSDFDLLIDTVNIGHLLAGDALPA